MGRGELGAPELLQGLSQKGSFPLAPLGPCPRERATGTGRTVLGDARALGSVSQASTPWCPLTGLGGGQGQAGALQVQLPVLGPERGRVCWDVICPQAVTFWGH